MKPFDYEQVGTVLAPLKAKFEQCAHGEGNSCDTLDNHLKCHASICMEVIAAVGDWARGVFAGELVFDPAAEEKWRIELAQIHLKATKLWRRSRKAEVPCWELPGREALQSALWQLQWLLERWVTPMPSVGPMARVKTKLSDEQKAAIQRQLSSLPPFERTGMR